MKKHIGIALLLAVGLTFCALNTAGAFPDGSAGYNCSTCHGFPDQTPPPPPPDPAPAPAPAPGPPDSGFSSVSEPATFDVATLTLHVPCLDLFGAVYFLDLVLTDPATLGFSLVNAGVATAASGCATVDLSTLVLHVPDLDLGASYWVDFRLSPVGNTLLFQLVGAGANP